MVNTKLKVRVRRSGLLCPWSNSIWSAGRCSQFEEEEQRIQRWSIATDANAGFEIRQIQTSDGTQEDRSNSIVVTSDRFGVSFSQIAHLLRGFAETRSVVLLSRCSTSPLIDVFSWEVRSGQTDANTSGVDQSSIESFDHRTIEIHASRTRWTTDQCSRSSLSQTSISVSFSSLLRNCKRWERRSTRNCNNASSERRNYSKWNPPWKTNCCWK